MNRIRIQLDPWQQEFIDTKGDKALITGRQVGKSEVCGIDAGMWATAHSNKVVLMIAPTERQAFALFDKTLSWIIENSPKMISKGKFRPTKSKITLTNKTVIWCLPTGLSGLGIRFLTVDRLYVDECARVPDEVFSAVTPMLLVTNGDTIYLSTPFGKGNMFANVIINKDGAFSSFTIFHTNSEDVIRNRKICATWTLEQRAGAIKRLAQEKARMTALQYAQEYEGELVDELRQFFSTELIKKCMMIQRDGNGSNSPSSTLSAIPEDVFLGVDVGRMGTGDSVLFSLALKEDILSQVDMLITSKTYLTDTTKAVLDANRKWRYKTIYIDDGGMGVGVFDPLLEHEQTKRKTVAINNASRALSHDGKKKKLLKEDLYNNLLRLMEQSKIRLWEDNDIMYSLKSIQAEYVNNSLRIFGSDSHITEALIRAAWCVKSKHLNIYIR